MQIYQKKNPAPAHFGPVVAQGAVQSGAPPLSTRYTGQVQPGVESFGQRVDLPSQIQSKMEHAFGVDFSGVQLYRSQTVADAGAEAVTQGSRIAFAPDRLNFFSQQGQSLLGHELSHVVSQARGEARGTGFLNSPVLESQADRQGTMAARGECVGPTTGTLSNASAASASGPMQARKRTDSLDQDYMDKVRNTAFDPVQQTIGNTVDHFNDVTDNIGDTVTGDSQHMSRLSKITAGTSASKALYDAGKSIEARITGEGDGDTIDQDAAILTSLSSASTNAATSIHEWSRGSKIWELDDDTTDAISGGGTAVNGMINVANAVRHFALNLADLEDGDQFDNSVDSAQNILEAAGDITTGLSDASNGSLISSKMAGHIGAGLQIASGAAGITSAIRHGVMAQTDRRLTQNGLRKLRAQRNNRSGEEAQKNDQLLEGLLSSQQRTANVHQNEAVWEGIHAGLDVASGASQFIPGAGTAASAGIGLAQKTIDFIGGEVLDKQRKVAREANLGQERMDLLRELTATLIKKRLDAKKNNGEQHPSLTAYERDQCIRMAKHTVNAKLFGDAKTNREAGINKTKKDVEALETLMKSGPGEGKLAIQRMREAGHAVKENTGEMQNKNASLAKLNFDLTEDESLEDTLSGITAKEEMKYHPIKVARAKAAARKQAREQAKQERAERKRNRANMSPTERFSTWATEKRSQLDGWLTAQSEARSGRSKARREARNVRKEAKQTYNTDRDSYVDQELANSHLTGLAKWWKKQELRREFKKQNEAQGSASELENAATGSATAGDTGWFAKKYLRMRRKHDRMRDSMVNDGWDQLGVWDRFKLTVSNPLAWIASKTESGKKKSNQTDQKAAEDMSQDALENIMRVKAQRNAASGGTP